MLLLSIIAHMQVAGDDAADKAKKRKDDAAEELSSIVHMTLIGVPLPKSDQKPFENRSEMDPQKSTKFKPKIDQKSFQNRAKIAPKSVPKRSKIGSGTDFASKTVLGPILSPFCPNLGPSWGAKSGHVGAMLAQKSIFEGPG